jgi:hypothetical protein
MFFAYYERARPISPVLLIHLKSCLPSAIDDLALPLLAPGPPAATAKVPIAPSRNISSTSKLSKPWFLTTWFVAFPAIAIAALPAIDPTRPTPEAASAPLAAPVNIEVAKPSVLFFLVTILHATCTSPPKEHPLLHQQLYVKLATVIFPTYRVIPAICEQIATDEVIVGAKVGCIIRVNEATKRRIIVSTGYLIEPRLFGVIFWKQSAHFYHAKRN